MSDGVGCRWDCWKIGRFGLPLLLRKELKVFGGQVMLGNVRKRWSAVGWKPRALDVTFFDVSNGVMMSIDSGFGALSVREDSTTD